MDQPRIQTQRIFAYIISTVDSRYRLTGFVPYVQDGKVFFGPCKRRMRPYVREGDYIMGISGSSAPLPRRIILWMNVGEPPMKFEEAWSRGEVDATFRKLRGGAIHIRPVKGAEGMPSPDCYEHIPGAPHEDDWKSDVRGNRDVFLAGASGSWVAEANGPEVTRELVEILRAGIDWNGCATVENPLTENAIGKHVVLTGPLAQQVILSMPKRATTTLAGKRSACETRCGCE